MASTPLIERPFDTNTVGDFGFDLPDMPRRDDGRVLPGVAANEAVRLLQQAEKLRAAAVTRLAVADNHEIAAIHGYLSPSRMIAHKASTSKQEADMYERIAKFLARHPATAQALANGTISLAHTDRLAGAAHQLHDEYKRDETQLLKACNSRDPEELGRLLAQWRWANSERAAKKDGERAFTNRGVTIKERFDGSGDAHAALDATGLASLIAALETAPDPTTTPDGPRTLAQRRADRLVGICDESLGHPTDTESESEADSGSEPEPDGERQPVTLSAKSVAVLLRLLAGEPTDAPDHQTATEIAAALGLPTLGDIAMGAPSRSTIDVIIDLQTLLGHNHDDIEAIYTALADGRPIPTPVWERLACDTSIRRVLKNGKSQIIDYGHKTPIISPQLRKAIRKRDLRCQFQGCDVHARYCDIHHLIAWHHGGPTNEQNLACVCRRHHGLIHDGGWQLHRRQNGLIHTTSP